MQIKTAAPGERRRDLKSSRRREGVSVQSVLASENVTTEARSASAAGNFATGSFRVLTLFPSHSALSEHVLPEQAKLTTGFPAARQALGASAPAYGTTIAAAWLVRLRMTSTGFPWSLLTTLNW